MPPRNDELPEGTDHIINGAMETEIGGSEDEEGSSVGHGAAGTGGGGASSGFIGSAGTDGTGGAAASGGTTMAATSDRSGAASGAALEPTGSSEAGGTASSSGGAGVSEQLKSQVYALRDQGLEQARGFADSGKTRASDLLEELSRVVADTADSIDERLGNNYGEYARKASDGVSSLAESLRRQDVDDLYGNVRSAVRKSPGVAVGIAAVLGFTLARLAKAGLEGGEKEGGGASGGGRGGKGA
jgi:hypothetical protein